MDGSKVTQSLESLWFYTNMLTHDNDVPSLTPPSINANESQKKAEEERMEVDLEEKVKCTNNGEKRERKRRKTNKFEVTKMAEVKADDDVDVGGFLRFDKESSSYDRNYYETIANHHTNNLPPLDDEVAMKKHLKAWAHAVANCFK